MRRMQSKTFTKIIANCRSAIGCANRPRFWVHQMHGNNVAIMRHNQPFESGIKADAVVSNDPGRLPLVRTADCAPVMIATADGKVVAAIHAGWRGAIANVVGNAVKILLELAGNPPPDSLIAAIGPCIAEEIFEVGQEVVESFDAQFGKGVVTRMMPDGKGRVNLPVALRMQLLSVGLNADRIDTTDRCSFRDRDEFFSPRRDKGVTGRMAAVIGARGVPGDASLMAGRSKSSSLSRHCWRCIRSSATISFTGMTLTRSLKTGVSIRQPGRASISTGRTPQAGFTCRSPIPTGPALRRLHTRTRRTQMATI